MMQQKIKYELHEKVLYWDAHNRATGKAIPRFV
jgi:hypothetical protein